METKIYYVNNSTNTVVFNSTVIDFAWKNKSKVWGDVLHKTCPYNAMFPARIADYFIQKYSSINDIVLDPFSGRGTTLLQGRILSRRTYASDLNPMSYVLTKSKEKNIDFNLIISRLLELENDFNFIENKKLLLKKINNLEIMRIYYSDYNLKQIIFLRERIGKQWKENNEIDNFILSVSLGLMHGPSKKDKTSSYFSLSMHNGVSMAPNYVKKYSFESNLLKPESNIFELIKNKITKLYLKRTKELKNSKYDGEFKVSNALDVSKTWANLNPNLIFTSPPYLNIINYTKQNWLKMWLLGFNNVEENKKIGLNDFHTDKTYLNEFLIKFMKECSKIMNPKSKLIMVIGDVIRKKSTYSISHYSDYIQKETGLFLEEIYVDFINEKSKPSLAMGSRAGKSMQVEKIYIFSKF